MAWSPDSQHVHVGTHRRELVVLNARSAVVTRQNADHGTMRSVWEPAGRWIACDTSAGIHLWSWPKVEKLRVLDVGTKRINQLTVSPDGRWLVAVGDQGLLRVWDTQSWQLTFDGQEDQQRFHDAVWHPRGGFAVVTGSLGCRFFTCDGGKLSPKDTIDEFASHKLAISPDGRRLALSGYDNRLRLANVESKEIRQLSPSARNVPDADWSPDGKTLAVASDDGSLLWWQPDSAEVRRQHTFNLLSVRWSPDGLRLASASGDGVVRLWDSDGKPGPELIGHQAVAREVSWNPDGTRLASCGDDGRVRIWGIDGRAGPTLETALPGRLLSVGWSPDGRHIAAIGDQPKL